MFTGLVQAVGQITRQTPYSSATTTAQSSDPSAADQRLEIDTRDWPMADVALGDSIAVQGACLTVVEKLPRGFAVVVSPETLKLTTGLTLGREVNLEGSLTLQTKLGGHMVTGHIDGLATVAAMTDLGGSWRIEVSVPSTLKHYIARKGSICLDGVSLTVNSIEAATVSLNIIPHTFAVTTIKHWQVGAAVNVEIDLIARYVERMLSAAQDGAKSL